MDGTSIERTVNPTIANRSGLLAPGWFLIIWVRRDIPMQQQNVVSCVRYLVDGADTPYSLISGIS